ATNGVTKVGGFSLNNTKQGEGPSGSGVIATITFKALQAGTLAVTADQLKVTIWIGTGFNIENDSLQVTPAQLGIAATAGGTPTVPPATQTAIVAATQTAVAANQTATAGPAATQTSVAALTQTATAALAASKTQTAAVTQTANAQATQTATIQ